MTVQVRNDANVGLLASDFQLRNEPNFAWRAACSAHLALPGLRAFWPMGEYNAVGAASDQGGQARALTYHGAPTYEFADLAPYIKFVAATSDYLSRADEAGLDILGTETYVLATQRGLMMGGWFYLDALGATQALIGKWDFGGGQASYLLSVTAANRVQAATCNPAAAAAVHLAVPVLTSGLWYHLVMRWIPNTDLIVYIDGEPDAKDSGQASLMNSTAEFDIGRQASATNYLTGRASLCFLCATCGSELLVKALYEHTRSLYGK